MDIDGLLADHTDEIAVLTRRLLERVAAATEWSDQRVYRGWHGVGFHHHDLGYVVGVFPRVDSARVVFEHGHLLGDAPFLEGNGRTRHVDFTSWDADRIAVVDDILDRALAP